MTAEITCVWTSEVARQMYDGYTKAAAELRAMRQAVEANGDPALHKEMLWRIDDLEQTVRQDLAAMVRNFTLPAAVVPKS